LVLCVVSSTRASVTATVNASSTNITETVVATTPEIDDETKAVVRTANAIGYENDDVTEDTIDFCQDIKTEAEKIVNESLDARGEIGFLDSLAAEESRMIYDYIVVKSREIMNVTDECITDLENSFLDNITVVQQVEAIADMIVQVPQDKGAIIHQINILQNDLNRTKIQILSWGEQISELADKVIAAARDAQEEIAENPDTSDESDEDAKDTKNKIKVWAENILEMTSEMQNDGIESYVDMFEDVDTVEASIHPTK